MVKHIFLAALLLIPSICRADYFIQSGSSAQCIDVFIENNSTRAGLTGLTFQTAGLHCTYHRDTQSFTTPITLVDGVISGWISSGFKEVDAANMPGTYRLCLPNTSISNGANYVFVECFGAANMAQQPVRLRLGIVACKR